jgi:CubicO group peptidase (beta-lactamase class C family)
MQSFNALFTRWDQPNAPGCVAGVIQNGSVIQAGCFGSANLDHGLPLTLDSVFNTASLSKQFTAACILLLEQQGEISLDDDIHRMIPEFPTYGSTITIRHLIHHTAGIRDYLLLMGMAGIDTDIQYFNNQSALEVIYRQDRLDFPPGEEFVYSNSGYILLAEIVRRVTASSLGQFARERIFSPLGMDRTLFEEDHSAVLPGRVSSYRPGPGGYHRYIKNFDAVGDGGLWTSFNDLVKWANNFTAPKVGGPDLLERMLVCPSLGNQRRSQYACGLAHGSYRGLPTVYHGGLVSGFRSILMRFPQQDLAVIILANLAPFNTTALAEQVADLFLEQAGVLPPRPPEKAGLSAEQIDGLCSFYLGSSGLNIEISQKQGSLFALALGMVVPVIPLSVAAGQIICRSAGGLFSMHFSFEREAAGNPWRLHARVEMHDMGILEMVTPQENAAHAFLPEPGEYHSKELQTNCRISKEDGRIWLRFPASEPVALRSIDDIHWVYPGGTLEFLPDQRNGTDGFYLSAGRPRNLAFKRIA